jgi:hypothetical protein
MESLLASIRQCQNREALESLLGSPLYALDGSGFGRWTPGQSGVCNPDVVEIYERAGCQFELCFKDGVIWGICGCPATTC